MKDPVALLCAIAIAALSAVSVVTCVASMESCRWNEPGPIVPEPGNPCGRDWHSCGGGTCCQDGWDCRPGGYCAWGGGEGPTWGAQRDGGPSTYYRQLTPEQVRAR